MKKVSVFNCRIRRKRRVDAQGEVFELVREFVVGEDDVLLQGTYHTCREALNRYYEKLICDPEQYVVQWTDEFGFIVHQLVKPEELEARRPMMFG
ncbi:hypothetical protein [Ketobacter sp.]|uniref:hypothetical protein n=1 Tax=Ketobacter sp. TaxID=2083498 RepID=UPI000F214340|nr:hypothetical protein [Ketobacter sp.]RLT94770.1 MAG: hypothetical protein D9N14_15885 [Ketobacter sp.]